MAIAQNDNRLDKFSRFVYKHPIYKDALDTVQTAISQMISTEDPMSALLTGATGTGKTTIIKTLMRDYSLTNEVSERENSIIKPVPAYHCVVPSDATIKSLAVEMLKHLDSTDTDGKGTAVTLTKRVSRLIKTCETKVIFLDEFQHLLTKSSRNSKDSVTDWVKTLMEETGVPVIIAGMPDCEEIIDQHPQLSGRYPYRAKLSNIKYKTHKPLYLQKIIEALLNACKQYAELGPCTILTEPHSLNAIYIATGGNMRSIRQLFVSAVDRAIRDERNALDIDDFSKAVETLHLNFRLTDENPFHLSDNEQEKILIRAS